jgi:hypothetical protein
MMNGVKASNYRICFIYKDRGEIQTPWTYTLSALHKYILHFLLILCVGFDRTPWMRDRPIASSLLTHSNTNTVKASTASIIQTKDSCFFICVVPCIFIIIILYIQQMHTRHYVKHFISLPICFDPDIMLYFYILYFLKCGVGEGWRRSVGPIM